MNMEFDNAQDDRDALEKHAPERGTDLLTGETVEKYDPETGALPWDGGGIKDGRIVSIEGLDRMGDHLVAYERGIAQNQRLHDAAVKRLEERLERTQAPLRREVARIRAMVEAFAQEQGRKGICIGRLKSRALPSGLTVGWRTAPARLRALDGEENAKALLGWALTKPPHLNLVRIKSEPAIAAIRKYAEDSGAPDYTPPGMERVPAVDELFVSTGVETKTEES